MHNVGVFGGLIHLQPLEMAMDYMDLFIGFNVEWA